VAVRPPCDAVDMTRIADILRIRMTCQLVEAAGGGSADPAAVVERLCAIQAQDYPGALWAVGLRCDPPVTVADVERAISERSIVRTWAMRGTLHFVAPADVRWMLDLTRDRALARATRRHADLGLTDVVFERARDLLTDRLEGGGLVTRPEAMALLEEGGVPTQGQRGYHILWVLALRGVLCMGPMVGRQQSFVLLDEWVPGGGERPADEAEGLTRLAMRYFAGHGPATAADFARWPGVPISRAQAAIATVDPSLETRTVDGVDYHAPADVWALADLRHPRSPHAHLLPGFDEYVLGYADRVPPLGEYAERYAASIGSNGLLRPTIVIDGRVAGTWKRTVRKSEVDVEVSAFRPLAAAAVSAAAERYGAFLGKRASVRR
jgi:hypothetical protein